MGSPPEFPSESVITPCCIIQEKEAPQQIEKINATTRKRSSENQLFSKRGSKQKTSSTLMTEAIEVLKQFCTSDPSSSIPSSQSETVSDTAHTLALFVETRLRSLPFESRKECENEIMKVLSKY